MKSWAWIAILVLTSIFVLGLSQNGHSEARKLLRIQLHVTGDDALTVGFANQIKDALSNSKELTPSSGDKFDVRMHLAGNLYWKDTEQGTNFNVVVIFTDRNGKYLGISNGACWESEMRPCADELIAEALLYAKASSRETESGP